MRVFLTGAAILFAVFVLVPMLFAAVGVAAAVGFFILKFVLVAMLVGWIATRLFGKGNSSGWCGGNRRHLRHHRQPYQAPVESRRMSREEWEWEHFLDEARSEVNDIDRSRRVP